MATSKSNAQWIVECDLCCTDTDVKWKCTDCDEVLCTHCQIAHAKSKASSKHKIESLTDADHSSRRAYKVSPCDKHPTEVYVRYCLDCDKLICVECISEYHHQHEHKKISDFVLLKIEELKKQLLKIKDVDMKSLEKDLISIKQQKYEYEQGTETEIDAINKDADDLKKQIDEARDKLIKKLKDFKDESLEKLKEREEEKNKDLEEMKQFVQASEKKYNTSDIKELVECLNQCDLETGNKLYTDIPSFVPTLVHARKYKEDMMEFIGYIYRPVLPLFKRSTRHKKSTD